MESWIDNAIIYHIFLDRFAGYRPGSDASKPVFCGGNIQGVTDKLNYIQTLGANTVWISPFYKTSAYHAYHIVDFDQPDERFGNINDIVHLIQACKEKGLRIIADIVPNHCSDQHKWFIEAVNNNRSQYRDWFYFDKDNNSYLRFLEYGELPKLNLENETVADYMVNSLIRWAKLGFDGYRIDHVLGIPNEFLVRLCKELKQFNPDFILIGEAWNEGMKYNYLKTLRIPGKYKLWEQGFIQLDLQNAYEGIIDGVLDFGWREVLINNLNLIKEKKYNKVEEHLESYNNAVSKELILPRFLDNHDTNRIMYLCKGDKSLFKDLLNILFQQSTPIVLFYGTEYGLTHTNPVSPDIGYSDLGSRGLIPWNDSPEFAGFITNLVHSGK